LARYDGIDRLSRRRWKYVWTSCRFTTSASDASNAPAIAV
jgi:hypothetical protein